MSSSLLERTEQGGCSMRDRMLRVQEVAQRLGCSVSSVWSFSSKKSKIPDFPKRYKIGPRITGFSEAEIENYIRGGKVYTQENVA